MISVREYIEMFACMKVLCGHVSEQIDPMGNHWCQRHEKRRQLMRFGYLNGWPALATEEYILDAGYWFYQHQMQWGKDEAIDALYEASQKYVHVDEQEAIA